jgi:hypothetical protein
MNLHLDCSHIPRNLFRSPRLSGVGVAGRHYLVDHPPSLVGYRTRWRRSSRRLSVGDVVKGQEARRKSLPVSSSYSPGVRSYLRSSAILLDVYGLLDCSMHRQDRCVTVKCLDFIHSYPLSVRRYPVRNSFSELIPIRKDRFHLTSRSRESLSSTQQYRDVVQKLSISRITS